MVRPPCSENTYELTKGPWTKEEDKKLIDYISKHGHESWRVLPKRAGLNRCGKSCRLRWINYLRPDIKRGDFSYEEEQLIMKLHSELGNKWSKIAAHLPRRTDNEIKNYWNTHMRKKLLATGVDPQTHIPFLNSNLLTNLSLLNLITYPRMNNAFYPTNSLLNLMQMLNQNAFDPTSFLLENAFDTSNQLQLSQSLMQIVKPTPIPNVIDSLGGISYPQQEPFHDINNTVKNPQTFNTLPSVLNPIMASFECEFEPKVPNMCYNNVNTGYITETESSIPNLVSVETPNIVNEVESNFSPEHSLSSIMFEEWDKFWDDEANVIQWP